MVGMSKIALTAAPSAIADDNLKWFGAIIPRRSVAFPEGSLDFDVRWDEFTGALDRQVNGGVFRPTLNTQHGVGDGTVKPKVFGVVERIASLSVEELEARGVTATVDGVYAGVRPSYDGALDGVEYVSFGIFVDFREPVTGEIWPIWLDELTAVDRPHIRVGQQPASELERIGFTAASDAAPNNPAPVEGEMDEEIAALQAEVERLSAENAQLIADKEALQTALDEAGASMESQAVDGAIAAGVDETLRPVLLAAYRGDAEKGRPAFSALVAAATTKTAGFAAAAAAAVDGADDKRIAGDGQPVTMTAAAAHAKVRELVASGVSLTEARAQVAQEVTNG